MNACSHSALPRRSDKLFWMLSEDNHHHSSQDISLVLLLYHAAFLRQDDQQERAWSYSKGLEAVATAPLCCEGMAIPSSGADDRARFPRPDIAVLEG